VSDGVHDNHRKPRHDAHSHAKLKQPSQHSASPGHFPTQLGQTCVKRCRKHGIRAFYNGSGSGGVHPGQRQQAPQRLAFVETAHGMQVSIGYHVSGRACARLAQQRGGGQRQPQTVHGGRLARPEHVIERGPRKIKDNELDGGRVARAHQLHKDLLFGGTPQLHGLVDGRRGRAAEHVGAAAAQLGGNAGETRGRLELEVTTRGGQQKQGRKHRVAQLFLQQVAAAGLDFDLDLCELFTGVRKGVRGRARSRPRTAGLLMMRRSQRKVEWGVNGGRGTWSTGRVS
jgi:hypothetical protein